MHEDRSKLPDLAGRHGRVEQDLPAQDDRWAERVGAVDWDQLAPVVQAAWGMDHLHG
jgi:hypothetical protein